MARNRNTSSAGKAFDAATIDAVWKKATVVAGVDSAKKRKDICGAWIEYEKYGETVEGGTGWEIDHVHPVSKGGTDDLSNLQPLQWENNRHKGDTHPNWTCAKSAAK